MRFFTFLLLTLASRLPAQEQSNPPLSGEEIYQTFCAACHGVNFEGGKAQPLIKEKWLFGSVPNAIRGNIKQGILAAGMPPFAAALSNEEIGNVTNLILSKQGTKPGEQKTIPSEIQTKLHTLQIEVIAPQGLRTPWGIEFVDEHRALVSERPGGLRWIVDGQLDPTPIQGLPKSWVFQDAGMLDIALHPNYKDNGWIYIANSDPMGDEKNVETPAMLQIIRGRIEDHKWIDQEIIFSVPHEEYHTSGVHFGCRMLFDKDGYLYFSSGDKGKQDDAQNLKSAQGKIHRIHPDGSFPKDNPFIDRDTEYKGIFTYGNRNPQGIAQHPATGEIWSVEHGPMGGDELNLIRVGANYGWPLATYGINHNGTIISDRVEYPSTINPVHYWVPSIACCPIEFVDSEQFPKWKNHLLVGALKFQEIRRLVIEDGKVAEEEILFQGYGRVRDLKFGPDGALYALLNNPDKVLKITPKERVSE